MYFPPGMLAVVKKKHNHHISLRDMAVLSQQFSAERALEDKIIDGIWKEEEAVKKVHTLAQDVSHLGENKVNMKKIKSELHREVIDACFNRQHGTGMVGEAKQNEFPKL
jgi:enoyl-CoA hydratase/carnithine racemase